MKNKNTGWGNVASWYDDLLETGDNYQKDVILPDVLSLLALKNGDRIVDLACGQGFFSRKFQDAGASVVGVDISKELIGIAKNYKDGIEYFVSSADKLDFLKNASVDKIVIILALQNITNIQAVFKECSRILKKNSSMVFVLNHPAFRVPKESSWGFDEQAGVQFRRVDGYISEFKVAIKVHPGEQNSEFTTSFHRPLQYYFKALKGTGFVVRNLHELISNKESQPGKRARAENIARKEIPLFMTIEAIKEL
ncbi:MAG: methyltransferase domain-containing protein [Candidatus Vogelbacteria bacterium]|nr:methyltransferase domain-containing protein [Candidatus Vogelbacteria bacterium]